MWLIQVELGDIADRHRFERKVCDRKSRRIVLHEQHAYARLLAMRYFFHLEDGTCIRDPKGVDDGAVLAELLISRTLEASRARPCTDVVVMKGE
jgi:hypothetical protein